MFPAFRRLLFFVKDGRTKVTSILFLFKHEISDLYLKFYDKSILSPSFEKKYSDKNSYQNRLSTYMFSLDAAVPQVFDIILKDKKIICTQMK